MFKNKKSSLIFIAGLLILILLYYNHNFQQRSVLHSEADLRVLETGSGADSLNINSAVEEDDQIVVHLAGAVKNAGVYKLNKSKRLVDLIKSAGGLNENADLTKINLAENLYDGQKLIIPELVENIDQKSLVNDPDIKISGKILTNNYYPASNSGLLNINQANQSQLEKLSGIGPSKAAAIIKYREQNSYFTQKEDLLEISGIGEKTLENIKDEIVLQ